MAKGISLHIGLNEVDPNHYKDGEGKPWKGTLAACENDARDMAALAEKQGFEVRGTVLTEDATVAGLVGPARQIAQELEAGDIFLLTYSGHGGQVLNTNPADDPEKDKLDETWCLYDREFLDDELFALLSEFKPGVRVVMMSDSCHSGTVARNALPTDDLPTVRQLPVDVAIATEEANAEKYASVQAEVPTKRLTSLQATVVLLSGCQDHQFSRDGRVNGAFTGALLEAWEKEASRKSLSSLLEAIKSGIPTEFEQTPNHSVYCFDIGPALVI